MKKLFLMALMSLGLSSLEINANQTHAQAITKLEYYNQQRETMEKYVNWSAVGGVIISVASILQDNVRLNTVLTTAFASWAFYMLMVVIKTKETWCAQGLFKTLCNKRVNTEGLLVNNSSSKAYELVFALDDAQFVDCGYKAGFSTVELIELARNAGRIDIALQLANHSYLKHHLNVVTI